MNETTIATILFVITAFVFVIGVCIGSFLNVVVLRTLSEESIVFPASKCPKCQNKLKWWHNIPILSYIFLRGKCGFCKEKISLQYPIIELITGIVFALLYLRYGISLDFAFMATMASLLIVIAGTDFKEKVVYDIHTISLTVVALLYSLTLTILYLMMIHSKLGVIDFSWNLLLFNPLMHSIYGIIAGIVIMEIMARFGYIVKKGVRAFEVGDTFIAAAMGAIFGWQLLILGLIISIIVQVIFFLPIFLKELIVNKHYRTLASFLVFVGITTTFLLMQHFEILTSEKTGLFLTSSALLAGSGLYTSYEILKGLREDPMSGTCLPFGPAMVIATLILLIIR
ncbi:MAG: prepilin peptidase [Candidatus Gastranaerophilales bacterium]